MATRTENSILNFVWGIVNRTVTMLGPFAVRTVFIYRLGNEYVGLNGLFSSILQVLSLSELGVASAVVYSMYGLLTNRKDNEVCALLNFYRGVYRMIGCVILFGGLAVAPFLPKLIKGEYPADINIYLVYLIFLLNTCVSYFLYAYKNSLLQAAQRMRDVNKVNVVVSFLLYTAQTAALLAASNYYLYAMLIPLSTVVNNIAVNVVSNKMFPNYQCHGEISLEMRRSIFEKLPGLFASSFCSASRTAFDGIFISAYIGLKISGMYGNYFLIVSTVASFFVAIQAAMAASVGNSIACESIEKNYEDFEAFSSLYLLLAGWATICLLSLTQSFVRLWTGPEGLLPDVTCFILCAYFYVNRMGDMGAVYYTGAGLWRQQLPRSLTETVMNLILNWVMVYYWSLNGIILATVFTIVFLGFGWGSAILFRNLFGLKRLKDFYIRNIRMVLRWLPLAAGMVWLCANLGGGWRMFLVKLALCMTVMPVLYCLCHASTQYYKKAFNKVKILGAAYKPFRALKRSGEKR